MKIIEELQNTKKTKEEERKMSESEWKEKLHQVVFGYEEAFKSHDSEWKAKEEDWREKEREWRAQVLHSFCCMLY